MPQTPQRFSPITTTSTSPHQGSGSISQPIKIPVTSNPPPPPTVLRGTPGKARASVEGLNQVGVLSGREYPHVDRHPSTRTPSVTSFTAAQLSYPYHLQFVTVVDHVTYMLVFWSSATMVYSCSVNLLGGCYQTESYSTVQSLFLMSHLAITVTTSSYRDWVEYKI